MGAARRFRKMVFVAWLCKRLSTLALIGVIATAALGITPAAVYNASGEPQLLRSGWLLPVFFAVWAFGLWLIERLLGSLALGIYTDDLDAAEQIEADPKGLFAVDQPGR